MFFFFFFFGHFRARRDEDGRREAPKFFKQFDCFYRTCTKKSQDILLLIAERKSVAEKKEHRKHDFLSMYSPRTRAE